MSNTGPVPRTLPYIRGAPPWQPATQYVPGAMVTPRSNNVVLQELPANNSFESGLTHWAVTGQYISNSGAGNAVTASTAEAYDGSESVLLSPVAGNGSGPSSGSGNPAAFAILTNDFMAAVTPGQKINFSCRIWRDYGDPNQSFCNGGPRIAWYNSSMAFLSYSYASAPPPQFAATPLGMIGGFNSSKNWATVSGTGIAPAGAAYASAVIVLTTTAYAGQSIYADNYIWDYTHQGYPDGLVFVAVQPLPGTSAPTEPVWPTTSTQTVVDNTVTWEAEYASQVTWTTSSILETGATEPVWPLLVGSVIVDNNIEWTATDGRITDPNLPQNSTVVAIGASKVFVGNGDIINFCATGNPQDWTSSQDAGFIPFGMNNYGNEDVKALNLYRSNLVAFNSLGYQMWQIDPDPANMAILDAEPTGCAYSKSIQPVNNDLVFLTPVGLRNIGTAGAAGNLQAGSFGKQIDPLVRYAISQLALNGYEVKSLFYSGMGQYWCLFGPEAFVLTINGTSTMSWTRYLFPAVITDWTVLSGALYLRAGDLVWKVDELQGLDDFVTASQSIAFQAYLSWEYLDFGTIGVDKQMEGFDIVLKGKASISFGYSQRDRTLATDWYEVDGDTVPGTMIPLPIVAPSIQARLQFAYGQIAPIEGDALSVAGYPVAEWSTLNIYVTPLVKQ